MTGRVNDQQAGYVDAMLFAKGDALDKTRPLLDTVEGDVGGADLLRDAARFVVLGNINYFKNLYALRKYFEMDQENL